MSLAPDITGPPGWVAAVPTPEAPAWTSTVSPACATSSASWMTVKSPPDAATV